MPYNSVVVFAATVCILLIVLFWTVNRFRLDNRKFRKMFALKKRVATTQLNVISKVNRLLSKYSTFKLFTNRYKENV